jgi:uncharacterized protein (TIGR02145 family)
VATGRESESATAASRFEDIFEVMAVAKHLAKDLTGVDLGTWTAPPVQPPPPPSNTFTDSRDGQVYRKVNVGGKTWMAQNLNYAASGSKCYENNAGNCDKYGRLYDWNTAMKACPAGWRLPRDEEWTALVDYAGGNLTAGTKLKSTNGWKDNGNGKDNYGFSALPGGDGSSGGNFDYAGDFGLWWSATEDDASYAWNRNMYYLYEGVYRLSNFKTLLYSVRCVQDGQ